MINEESCSHRLAEAAFSTDYPDTWGILESFTALVPRLNDKLAGALSAFPALGGEFRNNIESPDYNMLIATAALGQLRSCYEHHEFVS